MAPHFRSLVAHTGLRVSARKFSPTPELLESRDLMAVSPVNLAIPPKVTEVPASVSILFPVFKTPTGIAPRPQASPVGILFPVFQPGGYTNPCFSTALRGALS